MICTSSSDEDEKELELLARAKTVESDFYHKKSMTEIANHHDIINNVDGLTMD